MKKLVAMFLTLTIMLCLATSALAYTEGKNLEAPKAQDVVIDGDPRRVGYQPQPQD